ncbi:hypothetical protein RYH80_09370 [Halobaculum sp. MBLA0147]|uniref:hypothetical protein n=1 Tax=Halobaculum sp. MBLA0147 TaxID=3079934 RepID=UPI00352359C1
MNPAVVAVTTALLLSSGLLGGAVVPATAETGETPTPTAEGNVSVDVYRADGAAFSSLNESERVAREIRADAVRVDDSVPTDNTLLVRVESAATVRAVTTADGRTPTDRFFEARNRTAFEFAVDKVLAPEIMVSELGLNESNTQVAVDERNDTVYVAVNLSNAARVATHDGEVLSGLWGDYDLVVDPPTTNGGAATKRLEFGLSVPDVRLSADNRTLNDPPYTHLDPLPRRLSVSVDTYLLPGTPAVLATVGPNGTVYDRRRVTTRRGGDQVSVAEATLAVPTNRTDRVTLRISHEGLTLRTHTILDDRPPFVRNLTARITPVDGESRLVVSARVRAPEQALFVLRNESGTVATAVVPAGEAVDRRLVANASLAAVGEPVDVGLVFDADGDGRVDDDEGRFPTGDIRHTPLVAAATPTPSPTPTETERSATRSASPSPTDAATSTDTRTPQRIAVETPGVGLLAGLIATLLAAGLLSRR